VANIRWVDEPFIAEGLARWQCEYYVDEPDAKYPVGLAWVVEADAPGTRYCRLNARIVAGTWRRRGVASIRVATCKERWPGLELPEWLDVDVPARAKDLDTVVCTGRKLTDTCA
jgi:hypothetical protein